MAIPTRKVERFPYALVVVPFPALLIPKAAALTLGKYYISPLVPITPQKCRVEKNTHRRPKPGNRIPALPCREPVPPAPDRRPTRHVRKRGMQSLIQTRVQEPQWGSPARDQRIVHQRQYTRRSGTSGAGAIQHDEEAAPDGGEILALRRDVRVAAAGRVIQAAVARAEAGDVGRHDGVLVFGAREVV